MSRQLSQLLTFNSNPAARLVVFDGIVHQVSKDLGDTIDSWRVIGVEAPRRLSLAFGMKAPGAAVLEFEITPLDDNSTRITLTAYWHPAGVWGILYWLAFSPSHYFVFNGMVREIARRAEATERSQRRHSAAVPSPGSAADKHAPL